MKKYLLLILTLFLVACSGQYDPYTDPDNQIVIHADWDIAENDDELFNMYPNVFIVKINEYTETLQYNGLGRVMPKTLISATVIHSIQGEAANNIMIVGAGGLNEDGVYEYYEGNRLPEIGKIYLLFGGRIEENSHPLSDPRNIPGYYGIAHNEQGNALLNNYNESKSFTNQKGETQEIINNIINRYESYLIKKEG